MNLQDNVYRFMTLLFCITFWQPRVEADQVLIDRLPNPDALPLHDQEYPDFPECSIYVVANVVFDVNVEISSITTYFTNIGQNWPHNELGSAVLNVFEGALNSNHDPTQGATLAVFFADVSNGITVTASFENNPLKLSGNTQYWIGLTPILGFNEHGSEFHFDSLLGPTSMLRDPGNCFDLGSEWVDPAVWGLPGYSAAMTITGNVIPEPNSFALSLFVLMVICNGKRKKS